MAEGIDSGRCRPWRAKRAVLWCRGVVIGAVGIAAAMHSPVQAGEIEGFQSAHFGMTEAEVLLAIDTDFGTSASAAKRVVDTRDKTVSLTTTIKNVVNGTGKTRVGYVFGFRSGRLIQINLLWRLGKDAKGNPKRLIWAANTMMARFALQRYPRDENITDALGPNGSILMFRAVDKNGSLVSIRIKRPRTEAGEPASGDSSDERWWLRVTFIENVFEPDVFRIRDGDF